SETARHGYACRLVFSAGKVTADAWRSRIQIREDLSNRVVGRASNATRCVAEIDSRRVETFHESWLAVCFCFWARGACDEAVELRQLVVRSRGGFHHPRHAGDGAGGVGHRALRRRRPKTYRYHPGGTPGGERNVCADVRRENECHPRPEPARDE